MNLKSIINNKIIIYLTSRYAIYGLQFIVNMVIAAKLGPYYMGVYGFLQMILMYINHINFGIPHSLNVFLVHNKDSKAISDNYIGNSLLIVSIMSVCVGLFYLYYELFGIVAFSKYQVDKYLILTCVIGILAYFSTIIQTVVRIKNKLKLLALLQSLSILLQFCIIWFFEYENLILTILIVELVSYVYSLYLGYKHDCLPKIFNVHIDKKVIKNILKKGFYLFLYNSCFYFIVISIRTIISINYSVEDFGIFTFSYSLGNALLLISSSVSVIIFPKMLHQLSSKNFEIVNKTLSKVRVSYISATYFIVFLAIPFFPLIFLFLPQYKDALYSMNLVALAVLMYTNSFGYSTLLIARNKEKYSALISVLSLILNLIVSNILVHVVHVGFEMVIISIMITYLFYSFTSVFVGSKILGQYSFKSTLQLSFPVRLFIPYIAAVMISIIHWEYLIGLPVLLYTILNFSDIKKIFSYVKSMIVNQNMSDL